MRDGHSRSGSRFLIKATLFIVAITLIQQCYRNKLHNPSTTSISKVNESGLLNLNTLSRSERNSYTGSGTYEWWYNKTYSGEWVLGQPNGFGTAVYYNGDKYTGEFRQGYRHGSGTMIYQSGSVYVGNWSRDLMHGIGKLTYPNAVVQEGVWRDNKLFRSASNY